MNWALRRPAIQTSRSNETAGRAVDGIKSGHRDHHTETSEEDNPWWQVTLEREIEVQEVVITKRGDCCGRLHVKHNMVRLTKSSEMLSFGADQLRMPTSYVHQT